MANIRRILAAFLISSLFFSGCAYQREMVKLPEEPLYDHTVSIGKVEYVPLLKFCSYYNLDWSWDLVAQKIEIKRGESSLILRPNSRFALLNDRKIKLEYPIEYKNGAAYIPVESALFISRDIFTLEKGVPPPSRHHEIKTVVVDPGHGGKDPGAVSRRGTREKDIVLDVSKRLKRHLEKSGIKVILTRDRDIFIPLRKRADIANRIKADIFISVHANAARRSRTEGFEVFYLSEATDDRARAMAAAENTSLDFEENEIAGGNALSPKTTVWDMQLKESRRASRGLAYYICNICSDEMRMKKRGVKGANFAVLRGTRMPAVLVEVGFITNRREEAKLKKRSFREDIAGAISRSIVAYRSEFERTNGFSQ